MKARLIEFGEIEVKGKRYTRDVVIDAMQDGLGLALLNVLQQLPHRPRMPAPHNRSKS